MFLYDELPPKKRRFLEEALQQNWALREKLQVLKEAASRLSKCKLKSPTEKSVDLLLNYAAGKVKVTR
jgi:hypothetical protein